MTRQLALLTPAIILGLVGFSLPVCWVGSLVLMRDPRGPLAVRWQQLNGGLLSEIVDAVVDEAANVRIRPLIEAAVTCRNARPAWRPNIGNTNQRQRTIQRLSHTSPVGRSR